MSGASYESMFVVETKATGEEIAARSICSVGAFILLDRETGEVLAGASDRFKRLVTARARDILIDLIEVRFRLFAMERPEVRFKGRQSLVDGDRCRKCGVVVPDKVGGTRLAKNTSRRPTGAEREGRLSQSRMRSSERDHAGFVMLRRGIACTVGVQPGV